MAIKFVVGLPCIHDNMRMNSGFHEMQIRLFRSLFVASLIFLSFSTLGLAQETPPNHRKRVGLALGGGGALGLAHIGVLRFLEEHRIPVDDIAGTSMGGLLGGLYATGHDAADLEKIIRKTDWD